MSGERNLESLLQQLTPVLLAPVYVFASVPDEDYSLLATLPIKGLFHEEEGITLICEQSLADNKGLHYAGTFRCITCQVHSSLEAVGMTAAISAALAAADISANVVAAYFHDHIFVPSEHASQAVTVLQSLSASSYQSAQ